VARHGLVADEVVDPVASVMFCSSMSESTKLSTVVQWLSLMFR